MSEQEMTPEEILLEKAYIRARVTDGPKRDFQWEVYYRIMTWKENRDVKTYDHVITLKGQFPETRKDMLRTNPFADLSKLSYGRIIFRGTNRMLNEFFEGFRGTGVKVIGTRSIEI